MSQAARSSKDSFTEVFRGTPQTGVSYGQHKHNPWLNYALRAEIPTERTCNRFITCPGQGYIPCIGIQFYTGVSALRQKMIDAKRTQLHGFAERTQGAYLLAVRQLAKHYGKSPELVEEFFTWGCRGLLWARSASRYGCAKIGLGLKLMVF